jgi:hypothetical protein
MISFDTLKIGFPLPLPQGAELPCPLWLDMKCSDGSHTAKLEAAEMVGIGSASMDYRRGMAAVEFSAKLLADSYLQGINTNTIEQALHYILDNTGLPIGAHDILSNAVVYRFDPVNMVDLPEILDRPKDVIDTLHAARVNANYQTVAYRRTAANMGITYTGAFKSYKARLSMYYKWLDMMRSTKSNRAFFGSCQNPTALLQSMRGKMRIEQNSTDYLHGRKRLGIKQPGPIMLADMLSSQARPNLELFNTITQVRPGDSCGLLDLASQYDAAHYSFNEIVKVEGLKTIFAHADYQDEKSIQRFIQRYESQSNFNSLWYGRNGNKGIRDYWNEWQRKQQAQHARMPTELLQTIREQLAA